MRIGWFAALAVIGASLQAPSSPPELVVIVDADVPAVVAQSAARLRHLALGDIDRYGHARYFRLRAQSIDAISDAEVDSFRRTVFSVQAPAYNGVAVTFAEAFEILRKNEAVRDAVVRRECAASRASDCAGTVHAAALGVVADTEASSAGKLRHVVETAAARPGSRIVLVTGGLPYRDEQQLQLRAAVRDLQSAGCSLVVLRGPGGVVFRDLVLDASETLAARLSATASFIRLEDEQAVERARRLLAERYGPLPSTAARVTGVLTAAIPVADTAGHRAPDTVTDECLHRAAEYVALFERALSSAVWRERYVQEDRVRRTFSASGSSFSTLVSRRRLDSELLLVWLPADASWITVRDVVAIDGKPRAARDRPLQTLLAGPSVSLTELRQLAAENGRFNIGRIVRTFNEPTLALLFLDQHYSHRFTYSRRGEQEIDGRPAVAYEFIERVRPTVIRDGDRDVPARGTIWLDELTGRVLQTLLELSDPSSRLSGRMTVQYRPHPKFDVLVPVEMREKYTSPSGEEVTTVATYSDFRRFETSGRLVIPR